LRIEGKSAECWVLSAEKRKRMKRIERFEDLIAWQKARELTRAIYQITQKGKFYKDFGLAGQIQRAVVSIMSNIAEGFERYGQKEFHQFLSVAKASCAEVRSLLYVAFDIGYLDQNQFQQFLRQAEGVGRIVGALRSSIERNRKEKDSKRS
jgi:four helix bundle protein